MENKKLKHDDLIKQALSRPGVKASYEQLEHEFALLHEMIKARKNSGKTQSDVAKAMHTTTSVVGRLEAANSRHSPSMATLHKYADAVGCELSVKFVKKAVNKSKF